MYEYEYTVKSYFDILIKKYCVFECMQNATKISYVKIYSVDNIDIFALHFGVNQITIRNFSTV